MLVVELMAFSKDRGTVGGGHASLAGRPGKIGWEGASSHFFSFALFAAFLSYTITKSIFIAALVDTKKVLFGVGSSSLSWYG